MSYSITYNADAGFIFNKVTHHGPFDESLIRKLSADMARIVKEHDCYLILSDYRETTLDVSTTRIYDSPKIASEVLSAAGVDVYRLKRALVVSNDIETFRFFETVSRNQSHNVQIFQDMDKAIKWLTGK